MSDETAVTAGQEDGLELARAELCGFVEEWAARHGLTDPELLGVLAHLVGRAVAMQDPREVSENMAMDLVVKHLNRGNRAAASSIVAAAGRLN